MAMHYYMRFIMTLSFGIAGLSLFMKVLLENVFHDWDAVSAFSGFVGGIVNGKPMEAQSLRAEDILMEAEKNRSGVGVGSSRLIDKRREQLNEINEVETRLNKPSFSSDQENRWFTN